MKKIVIMMFAAALMIPVLDTYGAEGKVKKEKVAKVKVAKEKQPKAPLEELTITGKISKVEKLGKVKPAKDGQPETPAKMSTSYTLTLDDGVVVKLPAIKAPKAKKGEAAPADVINLDDFVDADVTIVAKGTNAEKKGKMVVAIKEVITVTKI